jgi:hypothetical protein
MMAVTVSSSFPKIIGRSLYTDPEKPHRFMLEQAVEVTLTNGERIIIPVGFVTDFASVPRLLRGIVQPAGNHNLATLIHDYLYDQRYSITNKADWKKDRLFADQEMLHWLKIAGASWIKCQLMYLAVRIGGKSWWLA